MAENSALAVDLVAGRGRALGARGVVVIDALAARRDGFSRRGLRISLVSSGDEVDLRGGTILVDPTKLPVAPLAAAGDGEPEVLPPWGRHSLLLLLERLARDPGSAQRAVGDVFALSVRADARTRFLARDAELTNFTVVDAILDIDALEGASRAAAALEVELGSRGN